MFGMCFDKRVVGGLVIAGVGVLIVAPHLIVSVLPLLLVAICPLSMLFMGKAMMGGGQRAALVPQDVTTGVTTSHACPMHRDVTSGGPGRCTTCGMALAPSVSAPPIDVQYRTDPALGRDEQIALLHLQHERLGEQQARLARQLRALQPPVISTVPVLDDHDVGHVGRIASSRPA